MTAAKASALKLISSVVTTVTLVTTAVAALAEIPSFASVKANWISTEGILLDRRGEPIHELRVMDRGRRLGWVTLDDISPVAAETIVRAEDKRFFSHGGVDWLALTDAALDSLLAKPRGASTISMQVAALIDLALMPPSGRRSLGQKWDQIQAAQSLEKAWTKREILETYLNLSTFRGELQGLNAAANGLFGKHPSGITDTEALLLAALLRAPNASPEQVARRACAMEMAAAPQADCKRVAALAQQALRPDTSIKPAVEYAPHVARALLSAQRPKVQSTLDGPLQRFVLETLERQLADLAERSVADGAVLVVDNASGEVLAYAGNAGNSASAFYVDGVDAPRQAGSTLKPFLYQLAVERRLLTAASLLEDTPVSLLTPSGLYVPQNYDREFRGVVSVRTALSGSLNVPAVRTLMLVGADALVGRLRALGFDEVTEDGDFYGYSLALGSAEVTLWQLTNAYRSLANGGRWSRLVLEREKSRSVAVTDEASSWLIADILADRVARSPAFGLDSPLATRHWAAVKTGTSKDMRDNWCIGFTDRYTIGVWVGNFDGSPMHDVSGVAGAAPVWLELVNFLHRSRPSRPPQMPATLVAADVDFERALEPPRSELFLRGTELRQVSAKAFAATPPAIAYPGEGSIIALDPDIPDEVQRVRFVARPHPAGYRWQLDGERIDPSALWRPVHGRHELVLLDPDGREVDRVRFEVR